MSDLLICKILVYWACQMSLAEIAVAVARSFPDRQVINPNIAEARHPSAKILWKVGAASP